MATLACPYCYQRVDGRRPWFRCTGRGVPGGTPCKPQHDEARDQALGIRELALPSFEPPGRSLRTPTEAQCPHCSGRTPVKVCPVCHTKLPPGFGEGESPLIAVIGAKGTGKSVYLTVLSYRLRKELHRTFQADVRLVGDHHFEAPSAGTGTINAAGELFPDGALYSGTASAAGGRREPVIFAWRRPRKWTPLARFDTTYLSFYDTAGEDLSSETGVDNLRYLGAADALILLLDPFTIPLARHQVNLPQAAVRSNESAVDVLGRVSDNLRLAHQLGGSRRIDLPVAVAFAKIDAFFEVLGEHHPLAQRPAPQPFYDEPAGRATHEHVRALLHQWRADDLDGHLINNYKTFRYFAVSALGAEPDYTNATVDEHGVHPFRVEEPLVWLLSRFGVVPTGSLR